MTIGGVSTASGLCGFAYKPGAAEANARAVMKAYNGNANRMQFHVYVTGDGGFIVYKGDDFNTGANAGPGGTPSSLGASATGLISAGVYYYVEVKWTINASTGSVHIYLNGTEVLALTGVDTQVGSYAAVTGVTLSTSGSSATADFDDVYVAIQSGGGVTNVLGDVTVTALYPSGAGTTTGWTPSAGSNYQNVGGTTPNDDTDYNSTSTIDAKDTYAMQDCASGADIQGIQILASVRKEPDGPGQVKLVTRSNSTDYDGTAQGIGGATYSYVREIRETDPATAAAWTESGWNAVELGLKKTA